MAAQLLVLPSVGCVCTMITHKCPAIPRSGGAVLDTQNGLPETLNDPDHAVVTATEAAELMKPCLPVSSTHPVGPLPKAFHPFSMRPTRICTAPTLTALPIQLLCPAPTTTPQLQEYVRVLGFFLTCLRRGQPVRQGKNDLDLIVLQVGEGRVT